MSLCLDKSFVDHGLSKSTCVSINDQSDHLNIGHCDVQYSDESGFYDTGLGSPLINFVLLFQETKSLLVKFLQIGVRYPPENCTAAGSTKST